MQLILSDRWLTQPKKAQLGVYLALSLLLAIGGYIAVTVSFIATKYPVSLFEAQLAFDAVAIKSHYNVLITQGTFDKFVHTQIIDFAWIIGLMLTLFFAHVAIARAQPATSRWQRLALRLAVLGPLIASADIFENLCSFVMLANPGRFPNWLALVYSSFAAIKWSWSVIGTTLVIIQIGALVVSRTRKRTP